MTPLFKVFASFALILFLLIGCAIAQAAPSTSEYTIPLRLSSGKIVQVTVEDSPGLPRLKACVEEPRQLRCVDVEGNVVFIPTVLGLT